jgi:hypothetical protein
MTYPDPRYPQQQPQRWPYPPGGYPNSQQQQPYPYAQPGHSQPYPQQPGYQQPYGYQQQARPEPQSNGNSAGWHAASIAIATVFRGTYRLGGSARSRVVTALMCMGIGLVALVIVVLAGTYLR